MENKDVKRNFRIPLTNLKRDYSSFMDFSDVLKRNYEFTDNCLYNKLGKINNSGNLKSKKKKIFILKEKA